MPGQYELEYGSSMGPDDGDISVSPDGRVVVGRTPKAAFAMNTAMIEPATPPFNLARRDKDISLVLHFAPGQVSIKEIIGVLNQFVPFEDEA